MLQNMDTADFNIEWPCNSMTLLCVFFCVSVLCCFFFFWLQQRQAELEAARLAKEKEEEEVRQQALVAKKEKEIQKKAIKKERQKLRTTCKVLQCYRSEIQVMWVKLLCLLRSDTCSCGQRWVWKVGLLNSKMLKCILTMQFWVRLTE